MELILQFQFTVILTWEYPASYSYKFKFGYRLFIFNPNPVSEKDLWEFGIINQEEKPGNEESL